MAIFYRENIQVALNNWKHGSQSPDGWLSLAGTVAQMAPEYSVAYLDSIHVPRGTEGDYTKSPVPWCSNDMVTNEGSIALGQMAIVTDTVEKLTGRKPMEARELLEKYSVVWKDRLVNYWDMVREI